MTRFLLLLLCATLVAADQLFGFDLGASPGAQAATLGFLGVSPIFRSPDPGAPEGGGSTSDDDPKITIGQRLSSALASKASLQATIAQRDATIADHDAAITRITQERDDANAALSKANTRIAALGADAAEVEKAIKASEAEVGDLKSKETSVEKKAQEKVGSLGFSASKLPAPQNFPGFYGSLGSRGFERGRAATGLRVSGYQVFGEECGTDRW